MTQRQADEELDFEVLRLGIERCDPDLILRLYAEHAHLSIVNAGAPRSSRFELRGKAEIAKHLRTAFGQGTSHLVEREAFAEDRVTFWETCEYPDGSRVVVETTLEVREGKIVRQVDVVARDIRVDSEEETGRGLLDRSRKTQPRTRPGEDATPTDDLPHIERAADEDLR